MNEPMMNGYSSEGPLRGVGTTEGRTAWKEGCILLGSLSTLSASRSLSGDQLCSRVPFCHGALCHLGPETTELGDYGLIQ